MAPRRHRGAGGLEDHGTWRGESGSAASCRVAHPPRHRGPIRALRLRLPVGGMEIAGGTQAGGGGRRDPGQAAARAPPLPHHDGQSHRVGGCSHRGGGRLAESWSVCSLPPAVAAPYRRRCTAAYLSRFYRCDTAESAAADVSASGLEVRVEHQMARLGQDLLGSSSTAATHLIPAQDVLHPRGARPRLLRAGSSAADS